jgi:DNA-binding FrmR family transcriptional regulator
MEGAWKEDSVKESHKRDALGRLKTVQGHLEAVTGPAHALAEEAER